MAEIFLNPNDLETIIKSYTNENDTFAFRSFTGDVKRKRCIYYINKKEYKIDFFIKNKGTVNMQSVGNSTDGANLLIEFIKLKGQDASIPTKSFTFECKGDSFPSLLKYIEDDCRGLVTYSQNPSNENIYKFVGYNKDYLIFTLYPQNETAMIQGRPLEVFSIITTHLATLPEFSFDDIVNMTSAIIGVNTPSSSIRTEMKDKLGDAYGYLPEAILKSISGSISLLVQIQYSEDYTGCLAGIFKALEGYLYGILVNKYSYRILKSNSFKMFYRTSGEDSDIDKDNSISEDEKQWLITLNSLYSSKRNVYMHAAVNSAQTRIISSYNEAYELAYDIIEAIKESYNVIFK